MKIRDALHRSGGDESDSGEELLGASLCGIINRDALVTDPEEYRNEYSISQWESC